MNRRQRERARRAAEAHRRFEDRNGYARAVALEKRRVDRLLIQIVRVLRRRELRRLAAER